MLAKKPLKNFGLAKEKATHKDAPEVTKKPRSSKVVKSERLGYDLEQLKMESGDVLSFEEVRARKFASREKRHAQPPVPAQQNRFLAASSSNTYAHQPVNSFLDTSAAVNTSVGFDEISRKLNFATSTKKVPSRHPGVPSAKMALLDQAAQEDMTINTRVAMSEVNDMFCSPEREPEVKVWDIREEDPVERKLHFSVFDDSVESVAPNTHDQSIREDSHVPIAKQSFSIFSDEAPDPPPTDLKAKGQQRKPLGSRDDLLRSVRLTNKDALMQLRKDKAEESAASPSDKR
ncbi:Bub protein kinase [Globisporangium polare]